MAQSRPERLDLSEPKLLGEQERQADDRQVDLGAQSAHIALVDGNPTGFFTTATGDLLQKTAQRDRFYIRPYTYYRGVLEAFADQAALLLAEHDGFLLGGIVVVAFGAEATYLYGASSNERRNLMAPYILQWEGMAWAAARGCQRYDLWGIPLESLSAETDADATAGLAAGEEGTPGMWGVYRFKRGFGGEAVRYAGAFDYVYAPLRYLLWRRFVPLAQRLLALQANAAREALD